LIAIFILLLIPAGIFVSMGPQREFAEAREKLSQKQEEVALVEQDIATLKGEMTRLQQDSYMEALARKELAYARPGEEVFIVKGLPEASEAAAAEERAGSTPDPGPLERLVEGLRGAF
jgi:cell division protein FtsB